MHSSEPPLVFRAGCWVECVYFCWLGFDLFNHSFLHDLIMTFYIVVCTTSTMPPLYSITLPCTAKSHDV